MAKRSHARETYGAGSHRDEVTAHSIAQVRADNEEQSSARMFVRIGSRLAERLSLMRRALAGGIALALAVGCAVLAVKLLNTPRSVTPEAATVVERVPAVEMVNVLVPVRPIERGQPFTDDLFLSVSKPRFAVNETTVRSFEQIRGQYARVLIPSQQPFNLEVVTSEKGPNNIVESIPKGYRAITIHVNATTGVEGWARAGAFVDVHWISDTLGEKSASLIVQNAKVLSAERTINPDVDPAAPLPTTVTLLVPLSDAQKIGLASTSGSLVLHLRGARDGGKTSGSAGTLTVDDLLASTRAPSGGTTVQGFIKFTDEAGHSQELAIVDGSIVRKDD